MKKSMIPGREKLKSDKSPYLDVEIAATREAITKAISEGYRLKTIWRSLTESGDITGSYSGFVKALQRSEGTNVYADRNAVFEPENTSRKNRSEQESEDAFAEAKQILAERSARN